MERDLIEAGSLGFAWDTGVWTMNLKTDQQLKEEEIAEG